MDIVPQGVVSTERRQFGPRHRLMFLPGRIEGTCMSHTYCRCKSTSCWIGGSSDARCLKRWSMFHRILELMVHSAPNMALETEHSVDREGTLGDL